MEEIYLLKFTPETVWEMKNKRKLVNMIKSTFKTNRQQISFLKVEY